MTDKADKQTGKKIRSYRRALGLSQVALENKSGVPSNTIARLERGEHTASIPVLKKLARALGVTINDLLV
jgi:transcriptional regulator with XRE-family HTH domain